MAEDTRDTIPTHAQVIAACERLEGHELSQVSGTLHRDLSLVITAGREFAASVAARANLEAALTAIRDGDGRAQDRETARDALAGDLVVLREHDAKVLRAAADAISSDRAVLDSAEAHAWLRHLADTMGGE